MDKNESKYFNTACLMDEALVDLINEKDYEYITVKELCHKAGVNRSTFYLHYETMDDLLKEVSEKMNREFDDKMKNSGASNKDVKESIANSDKDALMLINKNYLIPYLEYIKDNKKLYYVVYKNPAIFESKKKLDYLYTEYFKPIMNIYKIPVSKQKYIFNYYFEGILAIIKVWINDGCKDLVDDVCSIIEECLNLNK